MDCSGSSATLLQRRGRTSQTLPKTDLDEEAVRIHYVYGFFGPVNAEAIECEIPCKVLGTFDEGALEKADVLVAFPVEEDVQHNERHAITLAHSMESLDGYGGENAWKYDGTATCDLKSTVPWTFFNSRNFIELQDKRRQHLEQFAAFGDRKPRAVFVARDCTYRAQGRNNFVTALVDAGVPIDSISDCKPSRTSGDWPADIDRSDKLGALKKYRVYLALENWMEAGYVTEKIMDGYAAGNVNVYLGASDVGDYVPAGSFIDASAVEAGRASGQANAEDNFRALVQKIKDALTDEKEWSSYFEPLDKPMSEWSGGNYEKKWSWSKEPVGGQCRMCRMAFANRAKGARFNIVTQQVEGVVPPPFQHDFWKTTWKSLDSKIEVPQ